MAVAWGVGSLGARVAIAETVDYKTQDWLANSTNQIEDNASSSLFDDFDYVRDKILTRHIYNTCSSEYKLYVYL